MRDFDAQPLFVAHGHATFEHQVLHVKPFVLKTITAGLCVDQSSNCITRTGSTTSFKCCFKVLMRTDAGCNRCSIDWIFGFVIDDTTNGVGAIPQRCCTLEHFNAVHALNSWVVVPAVAKK